MKKPNAFWIFILGGLLLLSAAAAVTIKKTPAGGIAGVYQDGVLLERIDLSKISGAYSFTVEYNEGYNVITAERGRLCVSDADCPDGTCIRQGFLSGSAPIVCLPHRLVIRLEAGSTPDIDAVAG